MDSSALESSIGGRAAQRSPLQILVDIEGPNSTFQQDVSHYFCYVQLAQQASACCLPFVTAALLSFPPFPPFPPSSLPVLPPYPILLSHRHLFPYPIPPPPMPLPLLFYLDPLTS